MLSLKNILSRLELGIQHFLACVSGHLYLRVLVPADPVCLRTLGDLLSEGTRACGHQCLQALRICVMSPHISQPFDVEFSSWELTLHERKQNKLESMLDV